MVFSQLVIGGGDRRWIFQRALLLFLLPALLVIIFVYFLYTTERDMKLQTQASNEARSAEIDKTNINLNLAAAKSGLLFVRALTERMLYLPARDSMAHTINQVLTTTLSGYFRDLVTIEQKYDQARLLDNTGMEVIRVNLEDERAVLVPENQLQDKSERYYYKSTMALKSGEIYVSPFDLNIEHGKIERPLKPMLRLAVKVEDADGSPRGMVLLNVLGKSFIDEIHTHANTGMMVVNSDGYWIHNHAATGREWGFMFGRPDDRFQVDFPDAWSRINAKDTGQFVTPAGLFTFTSIYPGSDSSLEKQSDLRAPPFDSFWKIISVVPRARLDEINAELFQRWAVIGTVILSLLALIAFFIAQAQSARRAVAKRVLRLENQETLGQLANSVAHEFNNLLVPIRALSEMVMNDLAKDSSGHRRLEKVVEASIRAQTLTEGILVFGKGYPEEGASCDARGGIENAMSLVRDTLPSTIKLEENYADAIVSVAYNPRQLRIIILNLLSNARDALEGRVGTITIALDTDQPSMAEIDALQLSRVNTYAHLTVSDSGCGMNEETMRQALNPFFTTKAVGEGQGLGLYQVSILVRTAGGALSIISAPDVGTTATVWLSVSTDSMD